ncbi:MAG: D-alanyl-D-alanine carboxypeptidase family protein [Clostridia bacterium]|nr:D-alanyl-D-alanine carboxypeptidase family protein [Clostridia bacterium]
MRKVILFALTFFIIASLCICTAFASENVVFLSSGGTGDGSSADTPIGTLDGAYNALGTDGGTIVFMDEYSISVKDDVPKHTGKIIWTSVYGDVDYRESGAAFKFTAQVRVGFGGPTEIDYLNINDAVGGVFAANFNDFTIGSNVTSSTAGKTVIIGGANIDTTVPALAAGESCIVTVNGGSYNYIVAFSRMVSNISHEGTVTLNIGSDVSVINCFLGANGTNAKGGTTVFNISDNASVTGTLYLSSTNNGVAKVSNGSVTVNARGLASVAKILGYAAQWFPSGTRTLNYEETVSFPTPYTTYFGVVNVIEPEVPEEPEVPTSLEVVYLADGASGTGASADSPIGTFASAYNLLSEEGGTIILVGDTTVSENLTLPEISGDVLVKSEGGAKLVLDAEIILAKNTDEYTFTFDLPVTSNEKAILGGFNNVTFGENFAVTGALDFFGGALAVDSDTVSDTEFITDLPYIVTVKGGTFRHFAGGNYRHVNTAMIGAVAAPLTVNIEGGTFTDSFNLSGDSFLSDDATLTISGGTFECPLFVRSVNLTNQARATKLSPTVTSDRDYYAMDGDITIAISGGVFNGGLISAYDTDKVAYTQLLRGKFTVTVTGGTFSDGTVFDATQVKAYHGHSDDLASITYPNSYDFTITRFDSINGASQEYDEPLRIAFIGDSITEGVGSSDPMTKSYPAVFASLASNRDIVVANYGISGSAATPSTSVYYCDRLAWPVVTEETDADYIVIAIGTNDNAAGGVNSARIAFENSYKNIITTLGSLDTTKKVFITNAIARGSSEVTTGQIRVASVVRPLQERIANEYAATDAKKYVFVDLYGLTLHSAAAGPLLGSDNLHPNATGYVAMAEAIYGAIFEGKTTPETDYRHGDVYLSASGNPYASGTAEDPTSSIAHAMALMPLDGNGTLHISGTITCPAYLSTSSLPANLTIVGEGEGATLEFVTYETFKLLSNVKFDNITLKTAVSDMSIICGYNSAEFTDSVVFEGNWSFVAGLYAAAADTAEIASSANDCTITINATAAFVNFILGNRRFAATAPFGTYSGNMTVFVGDNVTASGNAGAVGQNYLAGSVTVSTPATLNLAEYAVVGSDPNSLYEASNNIGSITITKREAPAALEVVYLSEGASGTGESADSPIGTFDAAIARLDTAAGGTIVLVGTYNIDENIQLSDYAGEILITSVYGGTDYRDSGAKLVFAGEHHLAVGGPTTFDGITLKCTNVGTAQIASIAGNFFPLTIGEDVDTVDASENDAALLYIVGGPNNDTTKGALGEGKSSTLTVKSGSYQGITTFSRRIANLSHKGTMNVNISGNTYAKDLYLGTMGTAAAGGTTVFTIEDTASVNTLYLANYTNTKTNGTVTVTVKDNATVNALDKCADKFFTQGNAKNLNMALTASVAGVENFNNVSLIDVEYVTVADRSTENLTFASVNTIDVTAYAKDGLTLPYPAELSEFTLTLTYISGSINTIYTYSVKEENGVAAATLLSTESFDGSVVYVKDGGNGNGASAATPCGSIEAAHALLPNGGTVVLVGETTISAKTTLPTYEGVITYTNVYGGVDYRDSGARLYFPSGITVILGGEAVFKDIAIHTDTYTYISAGFNPLTFDTGVVTTHTEENLAKDSDEVNGLRITGGYNTLTLGEVTDNRNANITLKSGFFRYVHGFSRYSGKTTYTGTATIAVEGTAVVDELITGATQNDATAANVNLTLSDDARIYNVFLGGQQKTNLLTGTFNFVVNGGDIYEIDALCLFTAVECNSILTYDVNTVPEGLVMLAEVAQFKTIQTFCERDNTHNYSDPFASEFDESVMLKKCSICNDIQFVSELPEGSGDNVVFVAEGGLGDGSHPAIPTNDLYKAFETLKTSGGTIVIINGYTLKVNTDQKIGTAPSFFQEPLHTGAITVTSVYGGVDYREKGAKFVFDGNVDYKLSGPVTFDGIVFDATEETTKNTIAARYNPVIFGEDVVMLRDMDDAYSLDLIGGYNGFRYTDFTDVEIEDELIEMVNPARPLEINPETGDYTIDDPVFVEKEGVVSTFFLRKDAAESINKMFADMYELGLKRPNWISYAWRGYYAQYDGYSKQVGNIRVNYPDYDFEMAHQAVLRSCSLPGSSEHHLGYAIDFHDTTVAETDPHFAYDKTTEWAWLMQNAYKYGFILRFTPKDTATTGFIYEAWHFRYVGVEHATAIANLNSNGDPIANADMLKTPEWCLEDYAGLVLGMYDLDSSVTVNGGTFAHIEGGSRDCGDIDFTGEESVVIGEGAKIMPEGTTYDLVYFSSGADGDGLSAASPIGKIEKAYALLGNDGGTLVWMGELAVGAATELPEHTGVVTITSLYDGIDYREIGAALKYTAAIRVGFNGPTVVENFKIINAHGGDHLLCANFNELTLGEGMVLVDKNGATANTLTIVGGGNNNTSVGTLDAGETNTVTVMSGTYRQIVGFSAYNTNFSHEGTVNLNIGGDANFTSLIMGAKATGSKGGSTVLTLTDNAYIGTVYLANGDNTVALNGTATIYAKDNSEIGAFNHYRADLFPEGARSIYYDETASLPESLENCFDNISVIGEELLSGDATGDGVVTLLDVIRALRVCTGMTDEYSRAADVNGDGEITIADAMAIIYIVLNN